MWRDLSCFFLFLSIFFLVFVGSSETKQGHHRLRYSSSDGFDILAREFNDMDNFKKLLKPLLVPRMPDTDANRQVQDYIVNHFEGKGWYVERDSTIEPTPYGEKNFTNIIATFNPNAPHKLVLACHYDSKNMSSRGKYFIGATDSSVPCAILLDLVVQLNCLIVRGNGNPAKDITLQMVFFDGEEAYKDWTATDSLYGSRHLAQKWSQAMDYIGQDADPNKQGAGRTRLEAVTTLILLDLIGHRDMKFRNFFRSTSTLYENLMKREEILRKKDYLNPEGVRKNSKLFPDRVDRIFRGGIEDDHIPFLHRGVDILHLISYPFPEQWHKMTDDEEHLDFDVIDNFNRIFRVFISNYLHLPETDKTCRKRK